MTHKQNRYFITSSGTSIGKTFVTCKMIQGLKDSGKKPIAIKPIISGWQDPLGETDTVKILQAMQLEATAENIAKISPWRFTAPLSPDMAAAKENRNIDFTKLVEFCNQSFSEYDNVLIEGVGGVIVPINSTKTVLDWIKALEIEVIIVVGSYLGSISHSLTAIKSLQTEGIKIHKVIVNQSPNGIDLQDTINSLRNFTNTPIEGLKFTASS